MYLSITSEKAAELKANQAFYSNFPFNVIHINPNDIFCTLKGIKVEKKGYYICSIENNKPLTSEQVSKMCAERAKRNDDYNYYSKVATHLGVNIA